MLAVTTLHSMCNCHVLPYPNPSLCSMYVSSQICIAFFTTPPPLPPPPPHTHSSLCCQVIEEKCLQDLMYVAIHAPRGGPHSLFAAVRTVLTPFHRQQRGAGDTVHTLYQPFLWRSLKVQIPYNSTTRAAMNTYLICNSSPTYPVPHVCFCTHIQLAIEASSPPSPPVLAASPGGQSRRACQCSVPSE